MDNFIKIQIASEIWRIFKHSNYTQIKFAQEIGIKQPKLSRIFNGHLSEFTIDTLIKYLECLGAYIELKINYYENNQKQK